MENRERSRVAGSQPASNGDFDPREEFQEVRRRLDGLFTHLFGTDALTDAVASARVPEPDVNIYESDAEFLLHVALPGMAPANLQVEVTDTTLQISAHRDPGEADFLSVPATAALPADHRAHNPRRQGASARYAWRCVLPAPVEAGAVEAILQHGLLEIRLLKRSVEPGRIVPIQSAPSAAAQPAALLAPEVLLSPPIVVPKRAGPSLPLPRSVAGRHRRYGEGAPAGKLGERYVPSAGEDHVSQSQANDAKSEAAAPAERPEASAPASGQTTPLEPSSPSEQAAISKRS